MLRRFGISALVLGSVLAIAQPQVASARDRDDGGRNRGSSSFDRDRRGRESHEREEWREHERWEPRNRGFYNNGYYNNYQSGFGSAHGNGYGDPNYGWFDVYGNWHWY